MLPKSAYLQKLTEIVREEMKTAGEERGLFRDAEKDFKGIDETSNFYISEHSH